MSDSFTSIVTAGSIVRALRRHFLVFVVAVLACVSVGALLGSTRPTV